MKVRVISEDNMKDCNSIIKMRIILLTVAFVYPFSLKDYPFMHFYNILNGKIIFIPAIT